MRGTPHFSNMEYIFTANSRYGFPETGLFFWLKGEVIGTCTSVLEAPTAQITPQQKPETMANAVVAITTFPFHIQPLRVLITFYYEYL